MWKPVKRFSENKVGRDFIVGDIHGCFTKLRHELFMIDFNPEQDRLFSVGDLVDRGPESEEAAFYVEEPWFHAVRGNHEEMAIGVSQGRHDWGNYLANGGGWFLAMENDDQKRHADAFESLPYAIQVEVSGKIVGIVHAEVAGPSWHDFCADLESADSNNKRKNLKEIALWSRSRIQAYQSGWPVDRIQGADLVLVGHTPLKDYQFLSNICYVDTGAVFGGKLTVLEISTLLDHT